jgi:hypothetical protein
MEKLITVVSRKKDICIIFFLLSINSFGQNFVHPGVSHTTSELNFIKEKIKLGQQPWKDAFNNLKNSNYSKLTWTPQAIANVECGGFNNPAIGCREQCDDAIAASSHALLWYLTDNKKHAEKSIEILNNWTKIHKDNTNTNAVLQVGWAVIGFVDAAEILKYTDSGWKNTDITAFSNYLKKVYLPIIKNPEPWNPNWMFAVIQSKLAIAVFTDDKALFDESTADWKRRLVNMIYQTTDGPKPVKINPKNTDEEMDRNWYGSWSRNRFFDGFSQETCRDLGHLFLGSKAVSYSGNIIFHQGEDVFSKNKKRLTDFIEFHSGLINGDAYTNSLCGGTLNWDGSSTFPSGTIKDTHMELFYYHLGTRLGVNLPKTKKVVERSRPSDAGRWFTKWETLTWGNLPVNTLDINNYEIENDFVISPMPSQNGYFNLSHSKKFTVTDIVGKIILSGEGTIVNLEGQNNGIYFLKINNSKVFKLIIE